MSTCSLEELQENVTGRGRGLSPGARTISPVYTRAVAQGHKRINRAIHR